jgi:hypothetical protein
MLLACVSAARSSTAAVYAAARTAPRTDEPRLVGEDDRLHPVAELELRQQPRHVFLHGGLAEDRGGGDLGVRQALRDQPEHVPLALGEHLHLRRRGPGLRAGDEVLDQPPRDRRREQRFPAVDRAHCRDEVLRRNVIQQEAAGSGVHGRPDVAVPAEGRQHQHPRRRRGVHHAAGRLEPVQLAHPPGATSSTVRSPDDLPLRRREGRGRPQHRVIVCPDRSILLGRGRLGFALGLSCRRALAVRACGAAPARVTVGLRTPLCKSDGCARCLAEPTSA